MLVGVFAGLSAPPFPFLFPQLRRDCNPLFIHLSALLHEPSKARPGSWSSPHRAGGAVDIRECLLNAE